MPDSTASFLPTTAPADDLLRAVLDVSLTGINLLRPLYAPGGPELVDFALDYLNPAAQQLTGLPERPGGSLRAQFPATATNGVFAFYQRVFETGEAGRFDLNYQADGFDNYFHVAARRLGDQLVVSFNDTASYPRTAVEEALRESQAREQAARAEAERQQRELQRVFEQAPVAIAVYRGPNYVIELANPTVCRLWGRSQAQIIGKGLFEALPEVAGMGFEELLDEVMATGVPYVAYAMAAQHDRNGQRETVYWDFVYVPMHDAGGRTYGVMVVATEVTTQVLARQQVELLNQELESRVAARTAEAGAALREAEQQREQARLQQALLGQILGQVPAAIATLSGPEHRYTFFNAAYQALAGGRSVLGRSVAETLPEVVEQGFIGLLDQVYATGQPFAGTETLAMLDDPATGQARQHYIDFLYQPVFDGQQRTQGILAFAVDVTDRVRARKQAETLQTAMMAVLKRQSQARQDLYQIFEQTPAAIVLLREPNHRIDYYNPAFEALFPPEEWTGPLQGHTITEVYPRVKLAGLVELLDVVFRIGESQAVIEMPLERLQPGSPRYVTFAYQAYREQGHIVGVAAFVYDVTDQVLARQQVQALNEEMRVTNAELHDTNGRLSRTNADLDTFVYTASHDLKAPISNIEGLLMALRHDLPAAVLDGPLVPRLLDLMQGSVERFQQTIGHLTDIAQLQQLEATERVGLRALIQDVQLDLAPLIDAAAATLTVAVEGCQTARVAPKTLRSVVYNLLSNAVKYRAATRPAVVQLRAHCPPGQLVLEVRDNGLGLSEAQQAQLFGMFRRLHTHVEGSGVGLFMVKRLIENAGGTIAVRSQVDEGTTFTVTLPA